MHVVGQIQLNTPVLTNCFLSSSITKWTIATLLIVAIWGKRLYRITHTHSHTVTQMWMRALAHKTGVQRAIYCIKIEAERRQITESHSQIIVSCVRNWRHRSNAPLIAPLLASLLNEHSWHRATALRHSTRTTSTQKQTSCNDLFKSRPLDLARDTCVDLAQKQTNKQTK